MIQTIGIILYTMTVLMKKALDRLYYPTGAGPMQPPEGSSFGRLSPLLPSILRDSSSDPHFFFLATACGMQDLSSLNRDQTHASCSGSSLTHQTTKEVPDPHFSLPPWLCEPLLSTAWCIRWAGLQATPERIGNKQPLWVWHSNSSRSKYLSTHSAPGLPNE